MRDVAWLVTLPHAGTISMTFHSFIGNYIGALHLTDIYLIVSTRSLEFGPFTFGSIEDIDTGPINAEKVLLFLQQTKKSGLASVPKEDHIEEVFAH